MWLPHGTSTFLHGWQQRVVLGCAVGMGASSTGRTSACSPRKRGRLPPAWGLHGHR